MYVITSVDRGGISQGVKYFEAKVFCLVLVLLKSVNPSGLSTIG